MVAPSQEYIGTQERRGMQFVGIAKPEGQLDKAFEDSELPEDRDREVVNELLVRMSLG